MPWFWRSRNNDDEEEYDSDEYTDEECGSEELDSEDYSDNEEEEGDDNSNIISNSNEVDEGASKQQSEETPEQVKPESERASDHVVSAPISEQQAAPQPEATSGLDPSQPPNFEAGDNILSSDDDDFSIVESELGSDEDFLSTSEDESDDEKDDSDLSSSSGAQKNEGKNAIAKKSAAAVRVHTVQDDEDDSDEDSDDDEQVTSFAEKLSLLALAVEHDRVDILNAILSDDDNNKEELLNSGIPPLHLAISFGSTNACQSLLRMGADPSIRPNVASIREGQQSMPAESRLEIANLSKFDGVSAWELAFGSANYDPAKYGRKKSWFGGNDDDSAASKRVVAPVDMQPSKREGIRHAFTAESLRCIGADEVLRLKQLLDSGMPPTIDIGGKDLYGWAVEMGAIDCEELLRPTEAAKHVSQTESTAEEVSKDEDPNSSPQRFRVLDRSKPGDETKIPQLINRLDELESLASALSTCLDNLAEEVSVCHGLLLMGGGASALAAHVKSLKTLQQQKQEQMWKAQEEWEASERELGELIRSTGESIDPRILRMEVQKVSALQRMESFRGAKSPEEEDAQRRQLLAQIGASQNKILKLRASIADLSDENAREMEEVEKRGLTGGIDLVRTLREELRDIEFQLSEARNGTATCRAKIQLIHSKLPRTAQQSNPSPAADKVEEPEAPESERKWDDAGESESHRDAQPSGEQSRGESQEAGEAASENPRHRVTNIPAHDSEPTEPSSDAAETQATVPGKKIKSTALSRAIGASSTPDSEHISSGSSTAIAIRPPGNRGYFKIDLWQVILRIIGFDRAAARRSLEVAQQQQQQQRARANPAPSNPNIMVL